MVYSFVLKKNFWTSFLLRQQLLARPSSLQRRLLHFHYNHFSTRFYFLKSRGFLDKTSLTIIIINLSHNIGKGFSLCLVVESREFWLSECLFKESLSMAPWHVGEIFDEIDDHILYFVWTNYKYYRELRF